MTSPVTATRMRCEGDERTKVFIEGLFVSFTAHFKVCIQASEWSIILNIQNVLYCIVLIACTTELKNCSVSEFSKNYRDPGRASSLLVLIE